LELPLLADMLMWLCPTIASVGSLGVLGKKKKAKMKLQAPPTQAPSLPAISLSTMIALRGSTTLSAAIASSASLGHSAALDAYVFIFYFIILTFVSL